MTIIFMEAGSIPRRKRKKGSKRNYTLTIKMRKEIIKKIDSLVKYGYFSSRSEFVRKAVISLIKLILDKYQDKLSPKLYKEIITIIKCEE